MRAVIHPGLAAGTVQAPPAKSMAQRLLICAALARGESRVGPIAPSGDILAAVRCLRALGASVTLEGEGAHVTGCDPREAGETVLDCGESAAALRFLLPLCLLSGRPARLTGAPSLLARPLEPYADLCRQKELLFDRDDQDVTVQGPLAPGEYVIPGNVSSQFASGLLFALPLLQGESALRVTPPIASRPYLGMTLDALASFGITVRQKEEGLFLTPGSAVFTPRDAAVEGDYSNAAFFEALNCLGGRVTVTGLSPDSRQGDRVCAAYFARLARGFCTLNVNDCPDLAPVLLALAAARSGVRLTGTRRLRFKESDRGRAMALELKKFGAAVEEKEDEILVFPAPLHAPDAPLFSHHDHRVAMALAVLCTRTGGTLLDAGAVNKSLPGFWDALRSLGVRVECIGEEATGREHDL